MTLSSGERLGPYEILSAVGAGGMGEVYRARDSRLGREVAIKVVHSKISETATEKILRRFEQEARAAGTLNHPNIVAVHDIGSQDGRPYVVSELLEGVTLREKLAGGALPLRKAVDYAIQIAQALAAAHEHHIVHRDLKPDNIFITHDGRVKVLDFGLAKLTERVTSTDPATSPIDATEGLTSSGTVIGTIGYMSPEQVRGRPADARSDLFALGAVLYEMLSGRRAFKGPTPADTMTDILAREPAEITSALGPHSPSLDRIMRRCLEKDATARFQSARDLAFALERLSDLSTPSGAAAADRPRPRRARIGVSALLVITAISAAVLLRPVRFAAPRSLTLTRLTADSGLTINPALSRDGKLLAYASDRAGEGSLDIWVRQVGGGEPLRLTTDPTDDHEPSFSPDGTKVAFRSERRGGGVYVVSALGGDERLIVPHGHWPRFSPDGTQIATIVGATRSTTSGAGTAAVVPASGGAVREFQGLANMSMPIWSPDGTHILLFGNALASSTYDWWVVPADPSAKTPAIRTGAQATFERYGLTTSTTNVGNPDSFPKPYDWVDHRILFSATRRDSTSLWEIDISPTTFEITGPPRRLTGGTETESEPILGADSRLMFSAQRSSVSLWELPLDANLAKPRGEPRRITEDPAREDLPTISDNGRVLAFVSARLGNPDVWLKDLVTGKETALTSTPQEEAYALMTHDGQRVLYAFFARPAHPAILSVPVTGGLPEKICDECGAPTDVSVDGRFIVLQYIPEWSQRSRATIAVLDRSTGKQAEILQHTDYNLYRGHLSPDAKWITFHADHFGADTREFIAPFQGTEPGSVSDWISITDGLSFDDTPRWSPNGNYLYYLSQRDGFRCIWAQRLDPTTKRPLDAPTAVQHLHNRRRSISGVSLASLDLAVTRDKLIFNMTDLWGSLWAAELR
jgi:serine/threonine protein kinase/Tol biopolymer transport system component